MYEVFSGRSVILPFGLVYISAVLEEEALIHRIMGHRGINLVIGGGGDGELFRQNRPP